ncbi:DUF6069 family protein [Geodermatophilus sp. URMC 61]|uniref:DUF6069 family protein n=1 Tax=Geodermatophilus sp. URMC 61 TaxID=3423411 RepID=UPI00406CD5BA
MTSSPAVTTPSAPESTAPSGARHPLAAAIAVAAVGSAVVNSVIAAIARGPLAASPDFQPLIAPVVLMWTVVGTVVGAIGWRLLTRRSAHPARLMHRLVPTVVVVSLIPDLLLLAADSMPGTSVPAVFALMAMHVATAAVAVPAYQRFLPATD